MKISILISIILTFASISGAADEFASPAKKSKASIKEYTNSKDTLFVKAGEKFILKLDSNPTTGYQWAFKENIDKKLLKFINKKYVSDKAAPGMTGIGGDEYWTFKALKKGRASIKLKYVRPWESDEPNPMSENFIIIIN